MASIRAPTPVARISSLGLLVHQTRAWAHGAPDGMEQRLVGPARVLANDTQLPVPVAKVVPVVAWNRVRGEVGPSESGKGGRETRR